VAGLGQGLAHGLDADDGKTVTQTSPASPGIERPQVRGCFPTAFQGLVSPGPCWSRSSPANTKNASLRMPLTEKVSRLPAAGLKRMDNDF
jgi:hypothetical protein